MWGKELPPCSFKRQIKGLENWTSKKLWTSQPNCLLLKWETHQVFAKCNPGGIPLESRSAALAHSSLLTTCSCPSTLISSLGSMQLLQQSPVCLSHFPLFACCLGGRVTWIPSVLASHPTGFTKLPHCPHFPAEIAVTLHIQIRTLRSRPSISNPSADSVHPHKHLLS